MKDDIDKLRALHARILDRKPLVSDLPQQLQDVERLCREDENHPLCRWANENLSADDWGRISAAQAEQRRLRKIKRKKAARASS